MIALLTPEIVHSFGQGHWLRERNSNIKLSDLAWKVQDTLSSSILFFKTTKNNEILNLLTHLKPSNVGIVIVDNKMLGSFIQSEIPVYVCSSSSWLRLQKLCADKLYPIKKDIQFAGITGTNGKTSTTHFLTQILMQQNRNVLSLGTLGVFFNGKKIYDFSLTSPSYIDFRKVLHQFSTEESYVVFEMSSHALDQGRYFEIPLTTAGWTSFSQDHLDYHGTMDQYFMAKEKILLQLNHDGNLYLPHGQQEIYQKIRSDNRVKMCSSWNDHYFECENNLFKASFAKDNFIVAYEMAKSLLRQEKIIIDFKIITNAPGRWMLKTFNSRVVIIDYAHTPDALENVCQNAKQAYAQCTLKVLFGCGGDRDKSKRPLMGKAVSQFADYIYLTSDNPRTEDPEIIIDHIVPGITKEYFRCSDREVCLMKALKELGPNEVLIVAGKGHEDYIIKGTIKYPYSDELVCNNFIASRLQ